MDVLKTYKKLLAHFGPQGWWPIFDRESKCCKYFTIGNQVPNSNEQFEICAGAILAQNTAWKNVEKAVDTLYSVIPAKAGISPQFILSCKNLGKLIQPAGYYNQKAKKMRIFSKWWISRCHCEEPKATRQSRKKQDCFATLAMAEMRSEILSLWGIGPETADSMLLYAFNKSVFVIDAYTKRLCKECGIEFKTYDEYRKFFESQLLKSAKLFNEYHALIVAWGKLHAKDKSTATKIIK